jgi:hypothetical protein
MVAMEYGLEDRSSVSGRNKTFLHSVQTDSGIHRASYPFAVGGALPGGKCTIEEIPERKSSGFDLENRDYGRKGSAALTTRQLSV